MDTIYPAYNYQFIPKIFIDIYCKIAPVFTVTEASIEGLGKDGATYFS